MTLTEFDRATDEELAPSLGLEEVGPKEVGLKEIGLEEAGIEADERELEAPVEEAPRPRDEDPVRLYFGEMGKVRLLTAAQEVEIGRRVEAGPDQVQRARRARRPRPAGRARAGPCRARADPPVLRPPPPVLEVHGRAP